MSGSTDGGHGDVSGVDGIITQSELNASLEDISPDGWDKAKMSDLLISHMMLVMMR